MKPHRTRAFLALYGLVPHRLLGHGVAVMTRLRRPRWLVQAAIRSWVRRGDIDLREYTGAPYPSVEAFFLRRLRGGARPLGPGFVSPADGEIADTATIADDGRLWVKGRPISVDRLVNGRHGNLPLASYEGGTAVSIFLTPDGYHRLHMPADGVVRDVRWLSGRSYPQNADALRTRHDVYVRNERAVLRLALDGGGELLLVLVGASLIGGIHLAMAPRAAWVRPQVTPVGTGLAKGDELGWFTFGSTVVVIAPRSVCTPLAVDVGETVQMGNTLWAATGDAQSDPGPTTSP